MEWFNTTIVIVAGILTVFNLGDKVFTWVERAKKPQGDLESRMSAVEKKLEFEIKASFLEYDARFGRDKAKIDSIEEGNKVTQKALLALLEHSIDGNNTDAMKKAKKDLEEYLINR